MSQVSAPAMIAREQEGIGPAVRLDDGLAGTMHVRARVVVEHGGQAARLEQLPVVPVQVVCDEGLAGALAGVEGVEDGPVAAADRVAALDVVLMG